MTRPLNPYFTQENILFASVSKEGRVGSIYFKNGRIRLIHSDDPKVEVCEYKYVEYITISEADFSKYKKFKSKTKKGKSKTKQEKYDYIKGLGSCTSLENHFMESTLEIPAEFLNGDRLIEFFFDNEGKVKSIHPSRGGPRKPNTVKNLNQPQINEIYIAASFRDNGILFEAMMSNEGLKEIQIDDFRK